MAQEKILVIKLGALGDFIQALGPMKSIRAHHPAAHITLMTTPIFKIFGEKSDYFNEIWFENTRPKTTNIMGWIAFRKKLLTGNYTRIYDLQNNDRTNFYFKLFPKSNRPEWVGAAKNASHENSSPTRIAGHAFDGHKQTLGLAGIENIEIDNLKWINEDLSAFNLKKPYILFVPGSAPQHPQKRWPAKYYGELAKQLTTEKYQIILLGTNAEKEVTDEIAKICPECLNLTGKTSLFQIVALAQSAAAAIGNDTGPMHIIAPTQCPSITLFSNHSNPERHAPLGKNVTTIQKENIENISEEEILNALKNYI
ncbi:MAG: glycosyltransferase family 9 protein [Alphaproteobacteria bacterium]